ncbi:hypothetical protein N8344_00355 [bacterium]|jgi:hypothetical protein|nr:hypothetical protein [bacterium]
MSEIETKLAAVEAERLDVHVAANHERFKNIDQSIARVESQLEKNHTSIKDDIGELKKVMVWASSTLFGTMLIALLTSVFKVI